MHYILAVRKLFEIFVLQFIPFSETSLKKRPQRVGGFTCLHFGTTLRHLALLTVLEQADFVVCLRYGSFHRKPLSETPYCCITDWV